MRGGLGEQGQRGVAVTCSIAFQPHHCGVVGGDGVVLRRTAFEPVQAVMANSSKDSEVWRMAVA